MIQFLATLLTTTLVLGYGLRNQKNPGRVRINKKEVKLRQKSNFFCHGVAYLPLTKNRC